MMMGLEQLAVLLVTIICITVIFGLYKLRGVPDWFDNEEEE